MRIYNNWLQGTQRVPSPNFSLRPENTKIDLLVIHNISLPAGKFGTGMIKNLFTNTLPQDLDDGLEELLFVKVAPHLFIDRAGEITQFVAFNAMAWHAGTSSFLQKENCNNFSIGIELEGDDYTEFTSKQYISLVKTTKALIANYDIEPNTIMGHSDIAPNRKTDPGEFFDWRYFLQNIS
jgi:AmpD protein